MFGSVWTGHYYLGVENNGSGAVGHTTSKRSGLSRLSKNRSNPKRHGHQKESHLGRKVFHFEVVEICRKESWCE